MKRKTIIFSTDEYYSDEALQYALESLQDSMPKQQQNFSEKEIQTEAAYIAEYHWNIEYQALLDYFGDKPVLVVADIGRWNGRFSGGDIGQFEKMLDKILEKQDDFEVYDEDGHLYITTYHHDGRNYYEIKILTSKGLETFEKFYYNDETSKWINYTDRRLHKLLYDMNFYSKLPRFAEKVFGVR